jgi:hypothetical protein
MVKLRVNALAGLADLAHAPGHTGDKRRQLALAPHKEVAAPCVNGIGHAAQAQGDVSERLGEGRDGLPFRRILRLTRELGERAHELFELGGQRGRSQRVTSSG